jgi:hypothetical protein
MVRCQLWGVYKKMQDDLVTGEVSMKNTRMMKTMKVAK